MKPTPVIHANAALAVVSESGPRGRLFIRTLGCPKNEADGAAMIRHLEQAGWTIVDDPAKADAEIINTCGFIEQTKVESVEAIWEAINRKDDAGDSRRLIVTGCLAQRYPQQLAAEMKGLDAVVGFNRPDLVEKALLSPRSSGAPACWVEKPDNVYREHTTAHLFDEHHPAPLSAYIKVGDGCDNACRFCAIPLIRGRLRSRTVNAILDEIRALVDGGTREVILVSQDTTSWGLDRNDGFDLADLLRAIDRIHGDFWVRVMYAHPAFLTDRHIAAMSESEKVVPYLDMPLQHISDRMLRIMNRHTTRQETQAKIDALRRARPGIALRTTFIIGHPGETKHDFAELVSFAEDNCFERMGGFVYSAEDSTPAARLRGQVRTSVARDRLAQLIDSYDRWSAQQSAERIGQRLRCLFEQRAEDGAWEGRTEFDAPDIDGSVRLVQPELSAGFHEIDVVDSEGVDLVAQLATARTAGVLEAVA